MKRAPKPPAVDWPRRAAMVVFGLVVAGLEIAWLVWFMAEPLANAGSVDGKPMIRHWIFLARALPEVVPGVTFRESYLGMAFEELGHVEFLPQRVPIVLAAGLIGAAAMGLGGLILRALGLIRSLTVAERLALSYGLGAAGLGVVTLVIGRLGMLGAWPVRIGLGLLAIAEVILLIRERSGREGDVKTFARPALGPSLGFLAVTGPFLALMALGAMLPTIDFDAIEYHLQGPKEYYQAGRVVFLPHNVYTSMPFNVEMLHLLGMVVMGDWWAGALAGQLLVAAHAPAAAALVALTASRWGSARAGWFAAAVYLTTPWVYRLGVLPYVEGPLGDYHAALFWAGARAWNEADARTRSRFWALAGLLAGGAMGCKYTSLVSAVVPFGVVALADSARRRSPTALLAFSLGWAAVMAPWLVKNVIETGNPVYPLGFSVFGGRYWDAAMDRKWANVHGPRAVEAKLFWASFVEVIGRSDWHSPLYFALAPLAFLKAGSRRFATVLAGYFAYLFLTWWFFTHRLDRFWLPVLPGFAVLAGLGADWSRRLAWRLPLAFLMTIAIVTNLAYTTTALTGLNEWTADLRVLKTSVPERLNPPLAKLDAELPAGARVLLVGPAAVFHLNHPIVYNTVFDDDNLEQITRGRAAGESRQRFKDRGIQYVYIDWTEIERYRSPGNYGFTDYVTREAVSGLVAAGVLEGPTAIGTGQELYRVLKP